MKMLKLMQTNKRLKSFLKIFLVKNNLFTKLMFNNQIFKNGKLIKKKIILKTFYSFFLLLRLICTVPLIVHVCECDSTITISKTKAHADFIQIKCSDAIYFLFAIF